MADPYSPNYGLVYIKLGWSLTGLAVIAVALRLYSRLFLTRSAGSDDLAILFAVPLTISGEIFDSLPVAHGLGRHEEYLNTSEKAAVIKWEYILWIVVFLSFFFIRSSVMLFTLRLLPATKVWSARVTVVAFFLNFAITLLAVVTWGIKCVPFTAIYKDKPDAWCEPKQVTVATQKINGALACVIDIVTAFVPSLLLWNIQIKRTTKAILDIIFLLGLVIAGLSIGRAVAFPTDVWDRDTSYRLIKPSLVSLVEEKAGIFFACCPAIRQLVVYILRTGTVLPSRHRQHVNEDFQKMRIKVKFRDIFWYKKPSASSLTTFKGAPIYPPEHMVDPKTREKAEYQGRKSILDRIQFSLNPFNRHRSFWPLRSTNPDSTLPTARKLKKGLYSSNSSAAQGFGNNYPQSWPGSSESPERKRIKSRYNHWEWPPGSQETANEAKGESPSSSYRENSETTQTSGITPSHASSSASRGASPSGRPSQNRSIDKITHQTDRKPTAKANEPIAEEPPAHEAEVEEHLEELTEPAGAFGQRTLPTLGHAGEHDASPEPK